MPNNDSNGRALTIFSTHFREYGGMSVGAEQMRISAAGLSEIFTAWYFPVALFGHMRFNSEHKLDFGRTALSLLGCCSIADSASIRGVVLCCGVYDCSLEDELRLAYLEDASPSPKGVCERHEDDEE